MACIRKRGDRYQIIVSCGYGSDGKKIQRSASFKPEPLTAKGNPKTESTMLREAEAFARDFERKILTGQATQGQKLTFNAYAEKYIAECAAHELSPSSLEAARYAVAIFKDAFGYMTLENLTPLYLQEFFNTYAKTISPKTGKKIAHGTLKRRAAVLSAMLSQAVRWNIIDSNPMENVRLKAQAEAEEKPMYFTQEQAAAFLEILERPLAYAYGSRQRKDSKGKIYQVEAYQAEHDISAQLRLFFYLAIFTGCRRGELLALKWADIDTAAQVVHITKSLCKVQGKTIIKTTKTRKSVRKVSIPAAVCAIAKRWKAEQNLQRLSLGTQWVGDGYVFTQWNGAPMGTETPYQAFKRLIRYYNAHRAEGAPELPSIPLHGLRHTAATLLIARGVDVKTVSSRLGHADISTTLNVYSHALEELDRTATSALEGALLGEKQA